MKDLQSMGIPQHQCHLVGVEGAGMLQEGMYFVVVV